MFDFDKVPLKRKIIACIILALPAIYYVLSDPRYNHQTFFVQLFNIVKYSVLFLLAIPLFGGVIAFALLIVYGLVLLIGKILLGVNPENILNGLFGIGYVSLGISLIGMYYLAFGGQIRF